MVGAAPESRLVQVPCREPGPSTRRAWRDRLGEGPRTVGSAPHPRVKGRLGPLLESKHLTLDRPPGPRPWLAGEGCLPGPEEGRLSVRCGSSSGGLPESGPSQVSPAVASDAPCPPGSAPVTPPLGGEPALSVLCSGERVALRSGCGGHRSRVQRTWPLRPPEAPCTQSQRATHTPTWKETPRL